MALLHFSDILINAGLDPAKVQLIRHAMSDKDLHKRLLGISAGKVPGDRIFADR